VQIEQYPRLTEVGAWRFEPDGGRYGGFYTQEDIREVVAYAQARAITIVPEIDLPGHTRAVLASHPELSCTGHALEVPSTWSVFDDILCPGKDEVFEFAENVLSEVMVLFPGEYLHIGGDECPAVRWENCPHCAARIKKESLSSVQDLQPYFVDRLRRFIETKDRRVIGWDEILGANLSPSVAVMAWRGSEYGTVAACKGHRVVMSPVSNCYFDFYQAKENEPKAIGGLIPLEKVYEFEPLAETLTGDTASRVMGAQGNVWTGVYGRQPSCRIYDRTPPVRSCGSSLVAGDRS
jgi:hexosaminidase